MTQAPLFISVPEPVEVIENQDAEIVVVAEGKPCPQLVWYKDGKLLKESTDVSMAELPDGQEVTGKLTLRNTQLSQEGKYSVKATNKAGSVKTEIPIAGDYILSSFLVDSSLLVVPFLHLHPFFPVVSPPKFLITPDPLEVLESDAVKFYAKVTGKPIPAITWFRDNEKQLGEGEMKIQTKETARKLEVEGWLKIAKSALTDESLNYAVEAENSAGRVTCDFSLTG